MINKDMLIGEILEINPKYAEILMEAGMHCISCPMSAGETLEEACAVHGIDVEEILEMLNNVDGSEPTYETTVLDDSALWDKLDNNTKEESSE